MPIYEPSAVWSVASCYHKSENPKPSEVRGGRIHQVTLDLSLDLSLDLDLDLGLNLNLDLDLDLGLDLGISGSDGPKENMCEI